jgi:predicted nucleic acid-binding protein
MSAYLLDTTALIHFSKRFEPAYSQLLSWIESCETLAVNPIAVAEFYAGLSQPEAEKWEEFISALTYWPISLTAPQKAGQDRYTLAQNSDPGDHHRPIS